MLRILFSAYLQSLQKTRMVFFIRCHHAGDREAETSLPQDPKADEAARQKQLEERRKDYRWSIDVGTYSHVQSQEEQGWGVVNDIKSCCVQKGI